MQAFARQWRLPLSLPPAVDATLTGESMVSKAGIDPIFPRESIAHTLEMYLGCADPIKALDRAALFLRQHVR